jgi:hypothetical protein
LSQVIHANDSPRLIFGTANRCQQQRRENGNNSYDHQQFDQRESGLKFNVVSHVNSDKAQKRVARRLTVSRRLGIQPIHFRVQSVPFHEFEFAIYE